jgi:hypothetical protein
VSRPDFSRSLDRLMSAAYFLAALLVVIPAGDYLTNIWVMRTGDLQWRYGSEGLLAGFLLTPCLGLALALALATRRRQGRFLRFLGIVMVLCAVCVVGVCGDFVLNALQLRRSVPQEAVGRLEVGAVKTVVEYVLVLVGLISGGLAARRLGQSMGETRSPQVMVPRPGAR